MLQLFKLFEFQLLFIAKIWNHDKNSTGLGALVQNCNITFYFINIGPSIHIRNIVT